MSDLQQLIADLDASVSISRPSGMEPHHEDAEARAVAVPCQAETQTLLLFVQLHTQQRPLQVPVALTPPLCRMESRPQVKQGSGVSRLSAASPC